MVAAMAGDASRTIKPAGATATRATALLVQDTTMTQVKQWQHRTGSCTRTERALLPRTAIAWLELIRAGLAEAVMVEQGAEIEIPLVATDRTALEPGRSQAGHAGRVKIIISTNFRNGTARSCRL